MSKPILSDAAGAPEVLITPDRGLDRDYLREIVQHRALLWTLVNRDVNVRYKQTVIGFAWMVLHPAVQLAIYAFVFGALAQLPSDGLPYFVFLLASLVPWQFFTRVITEAGQSVSQNNYLVTKVYFPRIILVMASAMAAFADFLIIFTLAILIISVAGYPPGLRVLALPLYVALGALFSFALAVIVAAIDVRHRDIRMIVGLTVQVLLFTSAILYPVTAMPARIQPLLDFNPFTTLLTGIRWSLLDGPPAPSLTAVLFLIGLTGVLIVYGLRRFARDESMFADYV